MTGVAKDFEPETIWEKSGCPSKLVGINQPKKRPAIKASTPNKIGRVSIVSSVRFSTAGSNAVSKRAFLRRAG